MVIFRAELRLFIFRAVTFTLVNETASISTNTRLLNQYPCTRSIFNTWSNDVRTSSWRHWIALLWYTY